MSEFLAAAAANTGVPEELISRAAAARAEASGASADDILRAWAGGEAAPAGTATATDAATDAAEPPAVTTEVEPPAMSPAPMPEPAIAAMPAPVGVLDVPDSVTVDEAVEWPIVTTVTSALLKERTASIVPRWLMSVFFVVPFFALGYLLVFTGGADCGNAGQLQVDRFGQVVNCDGSPFEGKATASAGVVDYFGIGADVYARTGSCLGCHGANGEGGAGPAFAGGAVTSTFSVCEDHVIWVRLGTQAYGAEVGSTYGDSGKAVGGGGVMPGFAQLTDEELRGVVVYERVRFGAADEAATLAECGLVTPEVDEEAPADGNDGDAEGLEATAES